MDDMDTMDGLDSLDYMDERGADTAGRESDKSDGSDRSDPPPRRTALWRASGAQNSPDQGESTGEAGQPPRYTEADVPPDGAREAGGAEADRWIPPAEAILPRTRRTWVAVAKGFSGDDPLGFIDDPQILANMRYATGMAENPDLERKKWALAAYFSRHSQRDIRWCHDNLEQILTEWNGKQPITPDAAYNAVAAIFRPPEQVTTLGQLGSDIIFKLGIPEKNIILFGKISAAILLFGGLFVFCRYMYLQIKRICISFPACYGSLTDRQKIFLGLAAVAAAMLALAIFRALQSPRGFPYGYYVFMRIVTCGALVGLLLEKFPVWIRFPLLLLAILYNPIVLVHLGTSENWIPFNLATIPVLIIAWVMAIRRIPEEKTDGPAQTR